jgi:hypothetical protein
MVGCQINLLQARQPRERLFGKCARALGSDLIAVQEQDPQLLTTSEYFSDEHAVGRQEAIIAKNQDL